MDKAMNLKYVFDWHLRKALGSNIFIDKKKEEPKCVTVNANLRGQKKWNL